jgi:hypothetical protein
MTPHLLRGGAVVIAIAGVIDPALTTQRRVRPDVAVVAADTIEDRALAERVARTLRNDFRILRVPFAGAAASVVVGRTLPPHAADLASPVFVVAPDADEPHSHVERVAAPASSPLDAAVSVDAVLHVTGYRGPIEVVLRADGVAVDRVVPDAAESGRHHARLTFVPATLGPVALRVSASVGGEERAATDALLDVRARRWSVLFYDPRPSWQSTFVRRALERDARFDIAMRVVTSRAASVGAGEAPLSLDDAGALGRFDAIVVGAPDALDEAEVSTLDTYLRRRGGGVVLLLDNEETGPYDRLTAVSAWSMSRAAAAAPIVTEAGARGPGLAASGGLPSDAASAGRLAGVDTLRATEWRWPGSLPSGASAVARDSGGNAVIWRSPIGAGHLLVSGALDAWRFRETATSGFAAFWRAQIAGIAAASPPALDVRLAQTVLRPGARTDLTVMLRDLALGESVAGDAVQARITAVLDGARGPVPLRVWPRETPGRFEGELRAPGAPGLYRVRVSSGAALAHADLRVTNDAAHAVPDRPQLLRAWVRARGGAVLTAAETGVLAATLVRALGPVRRAETWQPMRSAWWLLPFTFALCGEWWWRRRRGHA